jgi:hypothetical protein
MKEAEELQEAANLESPAIEEGTDNSAAEPTEEGTTEDTAPAQETNEK